MLERYKACRGQIPSDLHCAQSITTPFFDSISDIMEKAEAASISMQENIGSDTSLDWSEEEESSMRWKLDLRIMPTVFVLFLLCYIDR